MAGRDIFSGILRGIDASNAIDANRRAQAGEVRAAQEGAVDLAQKQFNLDVISPIKAEQEITNLRQKRFDLDTLSPIKANQDIETLRKTIEDVKKMELENKEREKIDLLKSTQVSLNDYLADRFEDLTPTARDILRKDFLARGGNGLTAGGDILASEYDAQSYLETLHDDKNTDEDNRLLVSVYKQAIEDATLGLKKSRAREAEIQKELDNPKTSESKKDTLSAELQSVQSQIEDMDGGRNRSAVQMQTFQKRATSLQGLVAEQVQSQIAQGQDPMEAIGNAMGSLEAMKPLPPALRAAKLDANVGLSAIDKIEENFNPKYVGAIQGRLSGQRTKHGLVSEDEAKFRTEVSLMQVKLRKFYFGTAQSKQELAGAIDAIPNLNMSDVQFKAAMKVHREQMNEWLRQLESGEREYGVLNESDKEGVVSDAPENIFEGMSDEDFTNQFLK